MTSPAVVILTEPTHCESADANALVQALLQVQQLGQAGVPVSQALCDHPAEAMRFIDAYAKAYPELQMRSSDLPLPEHLYSMLSEGRLSPLQAPDTTRDNAKLEEGARLQPLYVLSLGAPDALMQALQSNGIVSNSIQVLEIAPIENSNADSVSVAEAVAARPLASPSWLAQTSASAHMDDEEPLEESANAPLKLESVEFNLDDIQIDESDAQTERSAPRAAIVDTNPVGPAAGEADAERPPPGKAPAEDSEAGADRPSQPTSAAMATEARESARTEPNVADPSTDQADAPDDDPTPPDMLSGEGAEEPEPPADASADGPNQPSEKAGSPGEPGPVAGESPGAPKTSPGNPDPAGSAGAKEDAVTATGETHSFDGPGGDVFYPPNGFASDDDDLFYPLPADGAPEAATLEYVLGLSVVDDVVDLEAMGRHLSDSAARLAPLDPVLTRPPASTGLGADRSGAQADSAVPQYSNESEPDDGAGHKPTPIVHDLDI